MNKSRKGKIRTKSKTAVIVFLVGGAIVSFIAALIISLISCIKKDVSLGFSIASSVIGILLSGVAIIYSYVSGLKLDAQLNRLADLIVKLRQEQGKIDDQLKELAQLEGEEELPAPLKKKLQEYRKDVNADISSIYDDL